MARIRQTGRGGLVEIVLPGGRAHHLDDESPDYRVHAILRDCIECMPAGMPNDAHTLLQRELDRGRISVRNRHGRGGSMHRTFDQDAIPDEAPQEEVKDDTQPLHVLIRVHHPSSESTAFEARIRLFTTDDQGKTYDRIVALRDPSLAKQKDGDAIVLFKDVVPDEYYTCTLSAHDSSTGFVLSHRHQITRRHRVSGLPEDP